VSDPVDNIKWLPATKLQSNNYNPNVVFNAELRLLERSILKTGWVQPILVNPEGIIIDGFHRVMLSRDSKELQKKYGGLVPCAVLDVDRPTAMVMTVRMNRAKGSHIAIDMSKLVKELHVEHGMCKEEIARELGATIDEVDLLLQDGVFKAKNIKDHVYSKAWYPAESKPPAPRRKGRK